MKLDILLKLRVLIWVLVLCLWGVMVYQYLGEDESEPPPLLPVASLYTPPAAPARPAAEEQPRSEENPAPARSRSPEPLVVPAAGTDPSGMVLPAPGAVGPAPASDRRETAFIVETPPARSASPALPTRRPRPAGRSAAGRRAWREDREVPLPDPPIPPGFQKTVTAHFNVYSERYEASDRFLELIENLHANLMLDLAPFSPWASRQKVSIFLFESQEAYRQATGRPEWSGGASSVPKRKVYVYESDELPGILAHELTHIYFDGFFLNGQSDPLWLSEGMATLAQVERGLAAPSWLRENLVTLENGGGLPFDQFLGAARTSGWSDDKVRLWYAQAFSVVRFLIRAQYRSSFYKFALALRDGKTPAEALYRAYGAPYSRLRALEIAWRHEISRPRLRPAAAIRPIAKKAIDIP